MVCDRLLSDSAGLNFTGINPYSCPQWVCGVGVLSLSGGKSANILAFDHVGPWACRSALIVMCLSHAAIMCHCGRRMRARNAAEAAST